MYKLPLLRNSSASAQFSYDPGRRKYGPVIGSFLSTNYQPILRVV